MLSKLKTLWTFVESRTSKNSLFLWILVWAQIAGLFVAYQAGILNLIWTEDITKLSTVILFIHILATMRVGLDTATKNSRWVDSLWLTADQVFAIGILGTLCGFIILMHEAFASGIPNTPAGIQKMLTTMSYGLGTAFWVCLTAVLSSIIQKIQVKNLEMSLDETK